MSTSRKDCLYDTQVGWFEFDREATHTHTHTLSLSFSLSLVGI